MKAINKIYCGDCIDVMKDIDTGVIDLILTDPPYLINYSTNHRKTKEFTTVDVHGDETRTEEEKHDFHTVIQNDNNPDLIKDYIKECYRIMKNNTAMYMFCSFDKVDFFKQELEKNNFNIKNMIVWVKNNWTAGDLEAQFGKQYEILFLVNKGRKKIVGKRHADVWKFDRVSGKEQKHQNEKPVELLRQAIRSHSVQGDLVFDGFGGSGATGVACINEGRNYILVEKEEEYFEKAKKWLGVEKKQSVGDGAW